MFAEPRKGAGGPIGYYVHHHGDGHRQRAMAVAACGRRRFVLLGTGLSGRTGDVTAIDLPNDRIADGSFDGIDGEDDRPRALHYAPLGHEGIRARMCAIAEWISHARPSLMVADVSVEVAMLARLCATPVAYVRLGGRRDDIAHLEAFRAAQVLIAPFSEALDDPQTPEWVRRKTIYAPGIALHGVNAPPTAGLVLVVCGRGGSAISISKLIDAANGTPGHTWRVIGLGNDITELPHNLVVQGWTADPESEIASAEIIVGGAGDGLVGAVLATRRPFVCIPEARPFDEQLHKAAALDRAGAAIASARWPAPEDWNGILASARAINPERQEVLDDPDGAARLSRKLIALADRQK